MYFIAKHFLARADLLGGGEWLNKKEKYLLIQLETDQEIKFKTYLQIRYFKEIQIKNFKILDTCQFDMLVEVAKCTCAYEQLK